MNTVLIFVVIPVVVLLVVAGLSLAGGDRARPARRYRPGRPYDFAPIWFLSSPEQVGSTRPPGDRGQLTGGSAAVEPRAGALGIEDSAGKRVLPGPVGGASDRW